MAVHPAESSLKNFMEARESGLARDLDAAPDRRLDARQSDLELEDLMQRPGPG